MGRLPRQELAEPQARHLVLFDGVCGLCHHFVQFVLRRDRRGVFRFASLQSGVGREAVAQADGEPALTSIYVIEQYGTARQHPLTKSEATLFVLGQLGWPWRLALVARIVPRPLLDRAYDVVARIRYRLFGRFDSCMMPTAEFRHRFLE